MDWDAQCPVCFYSLSSTGCPRVLIPAEWTCGSYNTAVICCGCQTCCVMKEQTTDRTTPSLNDSIMDRDRSLPRIKADYDAYCDCSQKCIVIFSLTLEKIPENRFAGDIVMTCNICSRTQFFIHYMFPDNSSDVIPNQLPVGYPLGQGFSLPESCRIGSTERNYRRAASLDSNSLHSLSSPAIGFKFEQQIQNTDVFRSLSYPSSNMPALPMMNTQHYQPMPEPTNLYPPFSQINTPEPQAVSRIPYKSIYPNLKELFDTQPISYNSSMADSLHNSRDLSRNPNFSQSSFLADLYLHTPGGYSYPTSHSLPDSQPVDCMMTSLQPYVGQPLHNTDTAMTMWNIFLSKSKHLPDSCHHCSDASYQQSFFNEGGVVEYVMCQSCGAKTNWDISSSARSTPKTLIEDLGDLEKADHVAWHRRCGIWHHAIIFDIDQNTNMVEVIHYNGNITKKNGAIASVRREWQHVKLTDRKFYQMDYEPWEMYPRRVTLKKAKLRLNEAAYNPFTQNCEHFARWCKTGHSRCIQLERIPVRVMKATDRLMDKLISMSRSDSRKSINSYV